MGSILILMSIATDAKDTPRDRHQHLMRKLNHQRKQDHKENPPDREVGDWRTIHDVDDTRLKVETFMTAQQAEDHAKVALGKREAIAYLVFDPAPGLRIHLWGLAAV